MARRHPSQTDVDELTDTYDRRRSGPVETPIDPIDSLVRSVKWLRWVIAGLVVPVVATATIAVRYVYSRAAAEAEVRIERTRLVEDVRLLKEQTKELATALRNAQEDIRANAKRIESVADQPRRSP